MLFDRDSPRAPILTKGTKHGFVPVYIENDGKSTDTCALYRIMSMYITHLDDD